MWATRSAPQSFYACYGPETFPLWYWVLQDFSRLTSAWRFSVSVKKNRNNWQQPYSGLCSPRRSYSTYFWNDSWVQTFHWKRISYIFVFFQDHLEKCSKIRLPCPNSCGDIISTELVNEFHCSLSDVIKDRSINSSTTLRVRLSVVWPGNCLF